MLGDHLHSLVLGDARVERVAKALQKHPELIFNALVVPNERADALNVALRNPRDVLRPLVPVDARTALLDQLRLDSLLPTLDGIEREAELHPLGDLGGLPLLGLLFALQPLIPSLMVGGTLVFALRRFLVEREGVHLGLDALVMGAERLENAPHIREHLGVVQRLLRRHPRRHEDRKDYVAVVLALRASHDAPDGLHHVHGGVLRIEEDDRVQVRDIYALSQAAGVRQDAALVVSDILAEPGDVPGATVCGHVAVHVP